MNSSWPICRLVLPAATSASTSTSRRVNPSEAVTGGVSGSAIAGSTGASSPCGRAGRATLVRAVAALRPAGRRPRALPAVALGLGPGCPIGQEGLGLPPLGVGSRIGAAKGKPPPGCRLPPDWVGSALKAHTFRIEEGGHSWGGHDWAGTRYHRVGSHSRSLGDTASAERWPNRLHPGRGGQRPVRPGRPRRACRDTAVGRCAVARRSGHPVQPILDRLGFLSRPCQIRSSAMRRCVLADMRWHAGRGEGPFLDGLQMRFGRLNSPRADLKPRDDQRRRTPPPVGPSPSPVSTARGPRPSGRA